MGRSHMTTLISVIEGLQPTTLTPDTLKFGCLACQRKFFGGHALGQMWLRNHECLDARP